jgi:hypothetical protein
MCLLDPNHSLCSVVGKFECIVVGKFECIVVGKVNSHPLDQNVST